MKDIEKIFDEKPKDELWEKLEGKLEKRKNIRKLKFYRLASIAAVFVALIAVVSHFSHILNDHNPMLFASNGAFSSMVLEELDHENDGLFNLESFDEIQNAYKQSAPVKPIIFVGDYIAKEGEIAVNISLSELTYQLTFSFDGLPILALDKAEGQTLYFSSENGKTLKLNVEAEGLKIIDSNFLPEYKGFTFMKLHSI